MPHVDHETLYAYVGERFEKARLRRGWSRFELAVRADVSADVVLLIEKGRGRVSLPVFFTVARTLGVPWAELFPPYGVRRIEAPAEIPNAKYAEDRSEDVD